MSDVARRQLAAVRAYKERHPEVDWARHVVQLRRDGDDWRAVGHEPGTSLFVRVPQ